MSRTVPLPEQCGSFQRLSLGGIPIGRRIHHKGTKTMNLRVFLVNLLAYLPSAAVIHTDMSPQRRPPNGDAVHQPPFAMVIVHTIVPCRVIVPECDRTLSPLEPAVELRPLCVAIQEFQQRTGFFVRPAFEAQDEARINVEGLAARDVTGDPRPTPRVTGADRAPLAPAFAQYPPTATGQSPA